MSDSVNTWAQFVVRRSRFRTTLPAILGGIVLLELGRILRLARYRPEQWAECERLGVPN